MSLCVLDFSFRKATGSILSIALLQLGTKLCLLLQKYIAWATMDMLNWIYIFSLGPIYLSKI